MCSKLHWAFCFLALGPLACAQTQTAAPIIPPMDGHARVVWLLDENLSVSSELDDIAIGAIETGLNTPKEYGPHWEGLGERIGLIAANYALKSTMEVTLGSIWGEDPRYFRTTGLSVKARVGHVIKMTFMAHNRDGEDMPAYARYIAFPGEQLHIERMDAP